MYVLEGSCCAFLEGQAALCLCFVSSPCRCLLVPTVLCTATAFEPLRLQPAVCLFLCAHQGQLTVFKVIMETAAALALLLVASPLLCLVPVQVCCGATVEPREGIWTAESRLRGSIRSPLPLHHTIQQPCSACWLGHLWWRLQLPRSLTVLPRMRMCMQAGDYQPHRVRFWDLLMMNPAGVDTPAPSTCACNNGLASVTNTGPDEPRRVCFATGSMLCCMLRTLGGHSGVATSIRW